MRLYYLVLISIFFVACNKHDNTRRPVNVISIGIPDVSIKDAPKNAVKVGNIDEMVPVVFSLEVSNPTVMIKMQENESWEVLQPLQKGQPTYVYDTVAKQLRFQWCYAGWGYAIIDNSTANK